MCSLQHNTYVTYCVVSWECAGHFHTYNLHCGRKYRAEEPFSKKYGEKKKAAYGGRETTSSRNPFNGRADRFPSKRIHDGTMRVAAKRKFTRLGSKKLTPPARDQMQTWRGETRKPCAGNTCRGGLIQPYIKEPNNLQDQSRKKCIRGPIVRFYADVNRNPPPFDPCWKFIARIVHQLYGKYAKFGGFLPKKCNQPLPRKISEHALDGWRNAWDSRRAESKVRTQLFIPLLAVHETAVRSVNCYIRTNQQAFFFFFY